ncbi:MAG: hypothetical protein QOF71_1937, partial [Candidatus Eremiobacteraeota bacterium]|nr:hypothetical protein [Candidatus Eremiobacteraeota bacterium]
ASVQEAREICAALIVRGEQPRLL